MSPKNTYHATLKIPLEAGTRARIDIAAKRTKLSSTEFLRGIISYSLINHEDDEHYSEYPHERSPKGIQRYTESLYVRVPTSWPDRLDEVTNNRAAFCREVINYYLYGVEDEE